jgi:hypothetical protein
MGTCLFAKPLISNGSCKFSYLAVVAQQQVYKYLHIHMSLRSFKGLLVDHTAAPSNGNTTKQHSQMNGHMTV